MRGQIEQLEKNLAIITEEKAQRAGQLQGELMEVCIWASELENECDKLEQDCVRMYSLLDAEVGGPAVVVRRYWCRAALSGCPWLRAWQLLTCLPHAWWRHLGARPERSATAW